MKKHKGIRPQDIVILLAILVDWKRINEWISVNKTKSKDNLTQASTKVSLENLLPFGNIPRTNSEMAHSLQISESEISESLYRSKFSGLLSDIKGKKVNKQALIDFLVYGLKYAFPTRPSGIGRGFATAHSAIPLKDSIISDEHYIWEHPEGNMRGLIIEPLYKTVPSIIANNPELYELLAITDAIRTGNSRIYKLAIELLKDRIGN